MYGITVVFKQRAGWSGPYTYTSEVPYRQNEAVVVPSNSSYDFYSVGRVIECKENFELDPKIKYRSILFSIEQVKKEKNLC